VTTPPARAAAIHSRLTEISGDAPTAAERQLLARLLRSWIAKTPAAIDRLAATLEADDLTAIRDQAHALKGSATNLGITSLAALFGTLEHEAHAGRRPDPDAAMAAIRYEHAVVEPICAAIADDLGG
jgi:histidine phosphotransfer protein HptB